mmetsp:Transcript_76824/g.237950  ORF Transcript_76824/g.237950 Transcript_76824/m.237950 type:complete len:256 (+) Transcript_76824:132-899(+)
MTWGFSCCCSPAPGEVPQKVQYATPAGSPKSSSGTPVASRGKQAAEQLPRVGGGGAGERRTSGASTDAGSPTGGDKQPERDGLAAPSADADQNVAVSTDAETQSARSTRSAKSLRSLGTSSNVSITSELIQERIPQREKTSRIQQAMKSFVRGMVRGQQMGVIAPDGSLCTCSCSMDKRLRYFIIELKGSERRISLSSITEVFQGKEPEDIDTPLDERCSTLMLERGDCISFHFPDVPAREHFAMCLQILVDGQQ